MTAPQSQIRINKVYKSFNKNEILHGVTFDVHSHEIVGLVGPSGCGKTTLIDILVGLSKPSRGSISINGDYAPYPTMRKKLGFMPQDTALYEDITAMDNLQFFGGLYGLSRQEVKENAARILDIVDLEHEPKKLVRAYSGGMKRRLSLATALLHHPEILILDEPTIGLDPVRTVMLWKQFRSLADDGASIIITTHSMTEAARCDRIAMMREGDLVAFDTPDAIIAESGCNTLESAFVELSTRKEASHA